ncbi:coiled-coil domain-containing protein 112 isoform X2 [Clupea harengus]|uniref:Coiled-coil domain-containing protein 112 isoform X2 n=1 Tax=Clupea harengus TaxID=7950 RepID=A0A6P8FS23_CLUHA|nr:coiled-coil domain-containing protein 112 isoform X2 [Clupea harengus]
MSSLTTDTVSNRQNWDGFDITSHGDNKKIDFFRKVENLKKLVEKNEKETWLKIHWKNGFGDFFSVVKELDQRLNHDLNNERLRVQQQLVKLRHGVARFQGQLTDVKPSTELIEKLQEIMTEVETSISTFKEDQHQSFEELLKEERVCWQELSAFEKKMETWPLLDKSDSVVHAASLGKAHVTHLQRDGVPPEVRALDTFLQLTGGQYGGWDQYDHQSFLQVLTKYGGRPSCSREAMAYLPARTQEEVRQHEAWYLKVQDLQERKKQAIHRWRTEREQGKGESLQQREELMDAERRKREEVAQECRLRADEEKREAAVRIEAWRSQRQLQQEQEKEQCLKEEVRRKRMAQEERRRQQEAQLAVKACVQQKKEQEKQRLVEKEAQERAEMEERRRAAAQLIQHFQERDLHKLETKLLEKQQKEEEFVERQKRLAKIKEKVEAHVTRDQARLCKPTKGWEERTKNIGPEGGGPVYQTFHRAVPSWRQDL